jgi:hypothetical protein
MTLTVERLKEVLHYDPATGVFRWLYDSPTSPRQAGSIAGSSYKGSYWRINIDGRRYAAHRLAYLYMTGTWPPSDLDHINRDRCDSRWANLRLANKSQNGANSVRHNRFGMRGVYQARGSLYSQIRKNGRTIYLGIFDTPDEAHAAFKKAAAELHGEFAFTP